MIVDEEVQDFLEHHGVKGMHWGRRKEQKRLHVERLRRVSDGTSTTQDRANIRARRIGVASLGAASVIAGGLAARSILNHLGHQKVSVVLANSQATDALGRKVFNSFGNQVLKVRVKDLPKFHANPFDPTLRRWLP